MNTEKLYDLIDKIELLFNQLEEVKKELQELAYKLTTSDNEQENNN